MEKIVLNADKLVQAQSARNTPQQVMAELVQLLYQQSIYALLAGNALCVLITLLFLKHIVPTNELLVWTGIMLVQSIIWFVIVARYRRSQPPAEKASQWITAFPVAGVAVGLCWGFTSFLPDVLQDATATVFLSVMILGITAAGLAIFSPYLRSFYAFAGLILIPYITRYFMNGSKLHLTLGIMFLLYLIVILISGHNMKRAVRKSIELRLVNLDLVDNLFEKNAQAVQAREKAEQADIAKSKFLAAASHDLRQPLHALGLFVDALESRIKYPEVRSIVDNIRISTDALSDLLNALLDISKLDAGVLEPKPVDFQLKPILQRIQTDFAELADSKSLQLQIVDCDYVVHTDPSMLERILRNLVSNAIRYTGTGNVKLDCQLQNTQVQIEVLDTGIGIASDQHARIFDEFYQVKNPERDRRKGLGLGLAIVQRLAELLNIQLKLQSAPGEGSVFSLSVPFVSSHTTPATLTTNYNRDLQGTRVLVIDDEAMIRLGMRKVLEEWACQVREAENIQQALDLLQTGCELDMILTDYRLRDNETGIQAIQRIYAHCGQVIPAIILTGDTDSQRLREAKDGGFRLLHKPVSPGKLRSLMSYLLEESRKTKSTAESAD